VKSAFLAFYGGVGFESENAKGSKGKSGVRKGLRSKAEGRGRRNKRRTLTAKGAEDAKGNRKKFGFKAARRNGKNLSTKDAKVNRGSETTAEKIEAAHGTRRSQ
jgi:hypothetical protein